MAKQTIQVTNDWQKIASAGVLVTVKVQGDGVLMFNESATDTDAYTFGAKSSFQFNQTESKETYVRSTGDGWTIIADGTL